MKMFFYLPIFFLIISGCGHKTHPTSSNPLFYLTNINYNNQNFTSSITVCNTSNQQFLSLTGINESGAVVGSVLKSASGNLSTDCIPYPIMFNNASSIANIATNTPAYISGMSFDLQNPIIFGFNNSNGNNGNIEYMTFNGDSNSSVTAYQIANSFGYDNISSIAGGFIAGISISNSNNPQPLLLYKTALDSQTPITLNINNSSFAGSLFNLGINTNQTPQQLIATGYQIINNQYNALVCNLPVNTTAASCSIAIPSYVSSSVTNMPINLYVAPDASIVYAVQATSNSSSTVSAISPANPTASPTVINALTPYNIESINYVSIKSKNSNGNILYGGAISVFTSADVGNPQYLMMIDSFGQYQVTPIALLLSSLKIANPNNYQFISADPAFKYMLLKNNNGFTNPNANSNLYIVVEFSNSGISYINNNLSNNVAINARISSLQSLLKNNRNGGR